MFSSLRPFFYASPIIWSLQCASQTSKVTLDLGMYIIFLSLLLSLTAINLDLLTLPYITFTGIGNECLRSCVNIQNCSWMGGKGLISYFAFHLC